MAEKEYDREIRSIKNEVRKYRPDSILNCAASQLHITQGLNRPAEGMPWFVLFLLKLSMLEGHRDGKVMSDKKFHSLLQKLLSIQILACPIRPQDSGVFELKIRAMILQQFAYQRDATLELKSIVRQSMWFCDEDEYYSSQFKKRYGLPLRDYYYISCFLIVFYGEKAKGVVGINLSEILYRLCPSIPLQSLFRFFALVGVRSQDLPEFFSEYRISGELNQQSEYFQPSPLRYRPVLIDGVNYLSLSSQLLARGLCSIVPDTLKKDLKEGFKERFGPLMESYVGRLMDCSGIEYLNEAAVKAKLAKHGAQVGKTADYVVGENGGVIIECKAIEPGDIVTSVFKPAVLESHLKESFLKAIYQIQDTAHRLKKIGACEAFFGLVVTHEDFWFANASDVAKMVATSISEKIEGKYGEIPVDLSRILFIQMEDFEGLIALHGAGEIDLPSVLDECVTFLQGPGGMRFTMHLLLRELLGTKYRGHPLLLDKAEKWMDEFLESIEQNQTFWRGKQIQLVGCQQTLLMTVDQMLEKMFKGGRN